MIHFFCKMSQIATKLMYVIIKAGKIKLYIFFISSGKAIQRKRTNTKKKCDTQYDINIYTI